MKDKFLLSAGDQGADGPVKPGPVPAVQHAAAAPAGARGAATPHTFLTHLARLRRTSYRRRTHRHTGIKKLLLYKRSGYTFMH